MNLILLIIVNETSKPTPQAWGSFIGSIISGIIALIIFLMGQYLEVRKRKKRELADLKAFEQYTSFQVADLYISGMKQKKAIIDFVKLIRQEKEQDIHFSTISSFNPKNLITGNKEKLFSLLVLKRKGNRENNVSQYSEFIKSLLLLSNIKKSILDEFFEFNKKYQIYITDYKSYLNIVARRMEEFGTHAEQLKIHKNSDPFLSNYDRIINNLIEDQEYKDIHKSYSKLIIPMHKLCSNKKIVGGDLRANVILKDLMQAKYSYENYIKLKNTYLIEFCKQARIINSETIKLQNSYNKLIICNLK